MSHPLDDLTALLVGDADAGVWRVSRLFTRATPPTPTTASAAAATMR